MNKMHWETLPKLIRKGNECVDWDNCINEVCAFEYRDVIGEIEIVGYNSKTRTVSVKYLDNDIFDIDSASLKKCLIGVCLGLVSRGYIYNVGDVVNDKMRITKQLPLKNNKKRRYECECIECGFNSDMEYYINGKLHQSNISACCRNNYYGGNSYKGFSYELLNKL